MLYDLREIELGSERKHLGLQRRASSRGLLGVYL